MLYDFVQNYFYLSFVQIHECGTVYYNAGKQPDIN